LGCHVKDYLGVAPRDSRIETFKVTDVSINGLNGDPYRRLLE
jgi:hypothetical protein